MPGLIWTASALRDLADLDAYLNDRGAGPSAEHLLNEVRAAADRLIDYPEIGRSIGENVRVWRIARTRYVLLYTVEHADIALLRVLHERRNWREDGSPSA